MADASRARINFAAGRLASVFSWTLRRRQPSLPLRLRLPLPPRMAGDFICFVGAAISVHAPVRPLVNDSALMLTQFDQRRRGNGACTQPRRGYG